MTPPAGGLAPQGRVRLGYAALATAFALLQYRVIVLMFFNSKISEFEARKRQRKRIRF